VHAAHLAAAVDITRLGGYLAGGMTSWREEKRPVVGVERMSVADLLERRDGMQVLDVREQAEWDEGRIPGSLFVPYHDIRALPEGLDPAAPVAVICGSGQRSAVAAGLLQRLGARRVAHVAGGGVETWGELGGPIESD
jgi:hydroxyacylglutathione hydrolase